MTSKPARPRRVAVVDVISDSMGREVVPKNYRLVGPENIVMECIMDSKARNDAIALRDDAEEARGTLENIRAREDAVAKREDAVRSHLMHNVVSRLDALAARIDSLESERAAQAKLAAHDPDDDLLPSPPASFAGDAGDLEATKVAPSEVEKIEPDPDQPRPPVAVEEAEP